LKDVLPELHVGRAGEGGDAEVRVPRDLSLLVKSKKVQSAVSDEGGDRFPWRRERRLGWRSCNSAA
jgi:hypothetical protein